MNPGLSAIEDRKRLLLAECAEQRANLAAAWHGLERPAMICDRVVNKLRSPLLWAGLGLISMKLPKHRLLRIPVLLWKGWKIVRRVRSGMR